MFIAEVLMRRFRVVTSVLLLALAACSPLPPRPDLPVESAVAVGYDSPLDRAIAGQEASHPQQSAFRLVSEGPEAFVIRVHSTQQASRSVDVQTYIWHADLTGMFLAQTLLEAADRGVKVRLLVDDMDARAKNLGFAALAAHPNVEVRMFNPFASRSGMIGYVSEGLTSFARINRRMHNKTWIADNRIAVVGGRNLGDEYFGASEGVNFVDLDFAMIGPVVRDASASFDAYWNSPSAYPMQVLDERAVSQDALKKLRAALERRREEAANSSYAAALRGDDAMQRLVALDWPMRWVSAYQFVADDPLKVTMKTRDRERAKVGFALYQAAQATQTSLQIISPYFVPGKGTTELMVNTVASGKQVSVLTNSLVANDVAAVHGGYSRYRKPLLQGGVQLWELKPVLDTEAHSSLFGSSGASLHTKALVVDDKTLFVGSYNIDPRSTWLNCEQGVLVEDPVLAAQFTAIFDRKIDGERSWKVTLNEGKLHWSDGKEEFDSDPKAGAGKRFQAWLARTLHLDAQL